MVWVGDGGAENGDQPVADELVDMAVIVLDDVAQPVETAVQQGGGLSRRQILGDGGETLQIDEHDRNDALLATQRRRAAGFHQPVDLRLRQIERKDPAQIAFAAVDNQAAIARHAADTAQGGDHHPAQGQHQRALVGDHRQGERRHHGCKKNAHQRYTACPYRQDGEQERGHEQQAPGRFSRQPVRSARPQNLPDSGGMQVDPGDGIVDHW